MLLIDDEPNKALGNPNWTGLFFKSFKGKLPKTKVQWLDLSSCLWPILIGLLMAKMVRVHHDIMQRYSKPCLSSTLQNYSWFLQYMNNDNGDVCNTQPLLSVYPKTFHFSIFYVVTL
jgi:hypothetical protein